MRALARTSLALVLLLVGTWTAPPPAWAQGQGAAATPGGPPEQRVGRSGLPLPRFVSLRAPKVNMRTGPGIRYPIEWVYSRAGLPVEVIDEFETWRRVRDWEGSVGWVHQSMLTNERGAMVVGGQRVLRGQPRPVSGPVALLEPGVIGKLHYCDEDWCRIEVKGFEGWLKRDAIYGTYPGEVVP